MRLPAICLGCNSSSTTAISNDYSFDDIFARELSAIGQSGDVFIGISTSGNSKNVLTAINEAKRKDIHSFGLTSNKGGLITKECPCIEIPSSSTHVCKSVTYLLAILYANWLMML